MFLEEVPKPINTGVFIVDLFTMLMGILKYKEIIPDVLSVKTYIQDIKTPCQFNSDLHLKTIVVMHVEA